MLFRSANAGTVTVDQGSVLLTGTRAGNYRLVWTAPNATITKAPLTITANDEMKLNITEIPAKPGEVIRIRLLAVGTALAASSLLVTRPGAEIASAVVLAGIALIATFVVVVAAALGAVAGFARDVTLHPGRGGGARARGRDH